MAIKNLVIFEKDTAPIIFNILQKYNLNESDEEVLDKFENDKELVGEKILKIIENIVFEIEKKENIPSLLENALNITKPTSEMLASDIKNQLLLIARKATPKEIADNEAAIIEAKKYPITPEEAKDILFIEPSTKESPNIKPIDIVKEDIIPLREKIETNKTREIPTKGGAVKKQDSYIEPL